MSIWAKKLFDSGRHADRAYKIALSNKMFEFSGEIYWVGARSAFERYIFSIDTLLLLISPCRFLQKHCLSKKYVMISRIVFRYTFTLGWCKKQAIVSNILFLLGFCGKL
jgi:hypothetical protein